MTEMTNELISNALDQDFNKANEIFGEIMTAKVNHMLDQEEVRLANNIYNNPDQLELDLDGEQSDEEEGSAHDSESGDEAESEEIQEPGEDAELEVDEDEEEVA